ncbi:uncharacterized protein LOC122795530 isoform X2 [Protopterus annectens]|uniref:uncharacterized protein LOC122795530 isoform X2 n=1 Tax=Protopterus annectens TaxID=7888 RepID=UPI001CFBF0FB|nr:uncharacterized protein LOC122795530 isoform X2 [Protopterus annectens]
MFGLPCPEEKMLNSSRKKVTFCEKTTYIDEAKIKKACAVHSSVIEAYFPDLVKQLLVSPHLIKRLKEKHILTSEQVQKLERKNELKVAQILQTVKDSKSWVFASFCEVLCDMGYWYLARTLQTAVQENSKGTHYFSGPTTTTREKQILNEVVLLPVEPDKILKKDQIIRIPIQDLRTHYLMRVKDLEEKLALARWERNVARKEWNAVREENEELRKLNNEIQALTAKLRFSRFAANVKDLQQSMFTLLSRTERTQR